MIEAQDTSKSIARSDRHFTTRQLLGFVAVLAVLIGLLRLGWISTSGRMYSVLVVVIPILLVHCGYTIGSWIAVLFERVARMRPFFLPIALFLLAATGYVLWARYRTVSYQFVEDPRTLPFPDEFLYAYHDYLDVTHPAPGLLKIHGEVPRLHDHLDRLALFGIALTAVIFGMAMPRSSWRRFANAIRHLLMRKGPS
jgi:hypothetical protein